MDVNSSTIIQKVKKFMIQHQMIEAGDHLVVGVSGGADSICLLLVLLKLRDVLDYRISVVNVEHGIRGAEAEQDAEFVRSFCEKHRIQCHICHYQVPEYAHAHVMSDEEAGRVLRYQAFRDEKKKYPGQKVKIAVAHHLQDHAETMLFNLVRGTGIHGLAAIAPVNGDVIRPLLHISRQEIEAYLEQMGQDFCTDATNEMDVYSRNQIRHRVLPVLCEINGCAAEHMYQTAQQLREIGNYLEKQAAAAQETCCRMFADGAEIKKDVFLNLEQFNDSYSVFALDHLDTLLISSIYYFFLNGFCFKRCKNCGKFFVPLSRSDEMYCNNVSPQDQMRTCKEYGSQKLWYDRLKSDEVAKLARNIYSAKQMLVRRNPDIVGYKKMFDYFKLERKKWETLVKSGEKSKEEYLSWLNEMKAKKTL